MHLLKAMPELEEALQFIEKIERENSGKSVYEIANKLRGYTKKGYTTPLWNTATGYSQEYIAGEFKEKLNQEYLVLSGEVTDFGHFIAALSDQINQPGVNWSDLTSWTGDHTSWAGDIGSAIIVYYSKDSNNIKDVEEALSKFARDSDYTADIAAYVVGALINSGKHTSISQAIYYYNTISYAENVRTFLKKRLGGTMEGHKLKNAANVEAEIRRAVSTFIRSSNAPDIFKSVKNLLKLQPKLELENTTIPNGTDMLQGSLHFLNHMVRKGGLDSLRFKPYQLPGVPWLGTVTYEVKVLR